MFVSVVANVYKEIGANNQYEKRNTKNLESRT